MNHSVFSCSARSGSFGLSRTASSHGMSISTYSGQNRRKSPCTRDRFFGGSTKSPSQTPPRNENYPHELEFSCGKMRSGTPTTPRATRKPAIISDRILDAPDLSTDFPSQLIDVSSQNHVAVALGSTVYIWNDGSVEELMSAGTTINSVCWVGDHVALSGDGHTELWDVNRKQAIHLYNDHNGRSGVMSAHDNRLATGGADGKVHVYDRRGGLTNSFQAHTGEVCGIAWSLDGSNIATSGEDELVNVWGGRRRMKIPHNSVVRGLAWMNSGILVTGETSSDGAVRMFHTRSDDDERCFMTHRPVTGLQWSPTWGIFASHLDNNGTWQVLTHDISKSVAEFSGHSDGIVNISASPNGDMVVTISSDETLRVWELGDASATPNHSPRFSVRSTPKRTTPLNLR